MDFVLGLWPLLGLLELFSLFLRASASRAGGFCVGLSMVDFQLGESGKSLGCVEGIMGVRCPGSKEVMGALGTTFPES